MYESCFMCGVFDNDHILKGGKLFCHECVDKEKKDKK